MSYQGVSQQVISVKRGLMFLGGWISAVLSLFVYPFVFGMLGVILGILATKDNKSRIGIYLIISSILLMGIGLAFSTRLVYAARSFVLALL